MSKSSAKSRRKASRRKLTRYIHTRSFSRISGFKGVRDAMNIRRNRIIMTLLALLIISLGTWFVFRG